MQQKEYTRQGEMEEMEVEQNRLHATELKVWQEDDETLQEVCKAAGGVVGSSLPSSIGDGHPQDGMRKQE